MPTSAQSVIAAYLQTTTLPGDQGLRVLLRHYRRPSARQESINADLKAKFDGSQRAWLGLLRQLAAFNNSGGGVLIFGVGDDGELLGLEASLSDQLDPAVIGDRARRYAPSAAFRTSYVECSYYGKRFGFLFILSSERIVIFDAIGNYASNRGSQSVFRPGVVYMRRPGSTAEAKQIELDVMVGQAVTRGVQGFLARIERVASLPESAQLIATSPGSERGYVLLNTGQGIEVSIVPPGQGEGAVPLSEVLLPDLPLSSTGAEVVAQVRQWRRDASHRVQPSTLNRWYLDRDSFVITDAVAEFCFSSALRGHGLPMFWASRMGDQILRSLVSQELRSPRYPSRDVIPYVVGAFFWPERSAMLEPYLGTLGGFGDNNARRIISEPDFESFRRRARILANTFFWRGSQVDVTSLLDDRVEAQRIYDELLSSPDNLPPQNMRQMAHQLDLYLHSRSTLP